MDHAVVAAGARVVERRPAVGIAGVGPGARGEEHVRGRLEGGVHERGAALRVPGVRVGALREERPDPLRVTAGGGGKQVGDGHGGRRRQSTP